MSQGSNGHGLGAQGRLTVVVSTYEWPEALDVVLRALSEQSDANFDIVVADDGSGPETAVLVRGWQRRLGQRLTHIWHADEGFRAARARNLGALARDSGLIAFLDGDCIPRRDFVRAAARPRDRGGLRSEGGSTSRTPSPAGCSSTTFPSIAGRSLAGCPNAGTAAGSRC